MFPEPPDFARLIDARASDPGTPPPLRARRLAAQGRLVRVRPGIYANPAPPLADLPWFDRYEEARRRYLDRVAAVALTHPRPLVFVGETALTLLGYPLLTAAPRAIEVAALTRGTASSHGDVRVHDMRIDEDELLPWGRHFVLAPTRALVEALCLSGPYQAVIALDAALSIERLPPELRVRREVVAAALAQRASARGIARGRWALDFARGESGSSGESASRVGMSLLGAPIPELQRRHVSPVPGISYFETDFEWPELRRIGEFDGAGKYLKPEYLRGREPGEVVLDEKRREDALRDEGFRVVRWGWHEVRRPWLLHAKLSAAGIPLARGPLGRTLAW